MPTPSTAKVNVRIDELEISNRSQFKECMQRVSEIAIETHEVALQRLKLERADVDNSRILKGLEIIAEVCEHLSKSALRIEASRSFYSKNDKFEMPLEEFKRLLNPKALLAWMQSLPSEVSMLSSISEVAQNIAQLHKIFEDQIGQKSQELRKVFLGLNENVDSLGDQLVDLKQALTARQT